MALASLRRSRTRSLLLVVFSAALAQKNTDSEAALWLGQAASARGDIKGAQEKLVVVSE